MYIAAAPVLRKTIRYSDQESYIWLWRHAPCSWNNNVELRFTTVPLCSLQPAGCWIDPAVVASYLTRIRKGYAIAPQVVCANESGGWYIHDGNHRYHAMQSFFSRDSEAAVRVAIAVPNIGFKFGHRWFGIYGTYLVEPSAPLLSTDVSAPFKGRTMVLVAHQDDETVCAGLLQRLTDPIIIFATNGAPADRHFWGKFGSREAYAAVRRNEARAALANASVSKFDFLSDHAPTGVEFRDQQLYRVLPEAFEAISDLVLRYHPDAVLVPAYEGGHPDHDSCNFLGALLRWRFGLAVWEMPLYHRSDTGRLVFQQFREPNGTERAVMLNRQEMQVRKSMIASYVSQTDVADFVSAGVELFRPQAEYDYSRPPHSGTVNYEAWQWPISPREVCEALKNCARALDNVPPIYSAACAAATGTIEAAPVSAVA